MVGSSTLLESMSSLFAASSQRGFTVFAQMLQREIGDNRVVVRRMHAINRCVCDERSLNRHAVAGSARSRQDIVDALVDLPPRLPGGERILRAESDTSRVPAARRPRVHHDVGQSPDLMAFRRRIEVGCEQDGEGSVKRCVD